MHCTMMIFVEGPDRALYYSVIQCCLIGFVGFFVTFFNLLLGH